MRRLLLILYSFAACGVFALAQDMNPTCSPDSTMLSFTRAGDLYVKDLASGVEKRLTFDGSELVQSGYASWVYYEEIFGRPSRYRAFWWSPDSRKIAFYRFDNTDVPMFPIYSPKGQNGVLSRTRYPKVGENNPKVRIGIVDIQAGDSIVWADFDENDDQYFGTPFWGADSKDLYVPREPRIQNTLDLYRVSAADGSKGLVYHESYKTWLDWIYKMVFTADGLYMVRSFETSWQQIYFLSYDGKTLKRLTDDSLWRVSIVRIDEKKGDVYFTARRESTVRSGFYKLDKKGKITPLTDTAYNAEGVTMSPDGKTFECALSNYTTPTQVWEFNTAAAARHKGRNLPAKAARKISDLLDEGLDISALSLPKAISLTTSDGLVLPGWIMYPKDFDESKKYPVHVDIYGGPDNPMVRDSWKKPDQWWAENGIIEVTVDCRAAGHNGRKGLDAIYRRLGVYEIRDFVEWGRYLQSLPYVDAEKIGVEGFSFGGTMTALLVMNHSDVFHYGIAGGGVYDWSLYDTHYTERFMETPSTNPEGFANTRAISQVGNYPVTYPENPEDAKAVAPVMLMLTHGTGDDNVHFQSTLQMIDALQRAGKHFELMVYPDALHGYRGEQARHDRSAHHAFWLKYLKR